MFTISVSISQFRQHHSCCLHEQTCWHQFRGNVCPSMENNDLVPLLLNLPQGQTYRRVQTHCPVRLRCCPLSVLCTVWCSNYFVTSSTYGRVEITGSSYVSLIKRPARDACLCMGDLQAPHFVFLIIVSPTRSGDTMDSSSSAPASAEISC